VNFVQGDTRNHSVKPVLSLLLRVCCSGFGNLKVTLAFRTIRP
jgi:hypothetical protein